MRGTVDGGSDREELPRLPSGNLPQVEIRDMPEPLPLRKVLGPSIILTGAAISSGEYVLWPYISSQVGLIFAWAAVIGVLTQYFINMEVERCYTLATGETAVTGFSRLWKPWGVLFVLMALAPNVWPGWATGAATMLTFLFGGGSVPLISVLGLLIIGVTLTLSPVVYQSVEKIEFAKVGLVLLFLLMAITFAIEASAWSDLASATADVGRMPGAAGAVGVAALLGAVAFAGAGGTGNLVQSNWIRDKGFGMGAHVPRIVSPVTGEEQAAPSTGYLFPQDEENLRRWRGWWRVANREQFWGFFVISVAGIIIFSLISYSTVYGQDVGESFDFIRAEGEALKEGVGSWFGTLFWLIGAVSLWGANLGILDYVSRLCADSLKVNYLRESSFWSESKLYFAFVWGMIAFGSSIILLGFDQPLTLLVLSSVLSAAVMFVYSILLIRLNRGALPEAIKMRGVRLAALVWAVLFFGIASAVVIFSQVGQFFGG